MPQRLLRLLQGEVAGGQGVVSGDADGVCGGWGDFVVLLRVGIGCGGGVLFAG